jgi:hypothetical protein
MRRIIAILPVDPAITASRRWTNTAECRGKKCNIAVELLLATHKIA